MKLEVGFFLPKWVDFYIKMLILKLGVEHRQLPCRLHPPKVQGRVKGQLTKQRTKPRVVISHHSWEGMVSAESEEESGASVWYSVGLQSSPIFPHPLGRGRACLVRASAGAAVIVCCSRRVIRPFGKPVCHLWVLGMVPDAWGTEIQVIHEKDPSPDDGGLIL